MGINNALDRLKEELERKHHDKFKLSRTIPRDRLRRALKEGVYTGGGTAFNIEELVLDATTPLLNEVMSMFLDKLGGVMGLDALVLTGGGSAILGDRLAALIGMAPASIFYAEETPSIQFANVRGAMKFQTVLEAYI